jgi:hypothetical protein
MRIMVASRWPWRLGGVRAAGVATVHEPPDEKKRRAEESEPIQCVAIVVGDQYGHCRRDCREKLKQKQPDPEA